jgi:hypothetical protein
MDSFANTNLKWFEHVVFTLILLKLWYEQRFSTKRKKEKTSTGVSKFWKKAQKFGWPMVFS